MSFGYDQNNELIRIGEVGAENGQITISDYLFKVVTDKNLAEIGLKEGLGWYDMSTANPVKLKVENRMFLEKDGLFIWENNDHSAQGIDFKNGTLFKATLNADGTFIRSDSTANKDQKVDTSAAKTTVEPAGQPVKTDDKRAKEALKTADARIVLEKEVNEKVKANLQKSLDSMQECHLKLVGSDWMFNSLAGNWTPERREKLKSEIPLLDEKKSQKILDAWHNWNEDISKIDRNKLSVESINIVQRRIEILQEFSGLLQTSFAKLPLKEGIELKDPPTTEIMDALAIRDTIQKTAADSAAHANGALKQAHDF